MNAKSKKASTVKKKAGPGRRPLAQKEKKTTQRASSKRNSAITSKSQDTEFSGSTPETSLSGLSSCEKQPDALSSLNVASDESLEIVSSNKETKTIPSQQDCEVEQLITVKTGDTVPSYETSETIEENSADGSIAKNTIENAEVESALIMINDVINESDKSVDIAGNLECVKIIKDENILAGTVECVSSSMKVYDNACEFTNGTVSLQNDANFFKKEPLNDDFDFTETKNIDFENTLIVDVGNVKAPENSPDNISTQEAKFSASEEFVCLSGKNFDLTESKDIKIEKNTTVNVQNLKAAENVGDETSCQEVKFSASEEMLPSSGEKNSDRDSGLKDLSSFSKKESLSVAVKENDTMDVDPCSTGTHTALITRKVSVLTKIIFMSYCFLG